jgi:hypothetical protein
MCYAYEEGSIFYNQQYKTLSDQKKAYNNNKKTKSVFVS